MTDQVRGRIKVMAIAVAANTVLVVLRFIIYRMTGSTAVLADTLESVVNIFASSFALYAVWLSNRRDDSHPFGHPFIETWSSGVAAALIAVRMTGRSEIDRAVAFALAIFTAWEGSGLLRRSVPTLVAEMEAN